MGAITVTPAEKTRTRDGRQWLKDAEFCDSIKVALKQTYDSQTYLATPATGLTELRKVRGALRYFAEAQGWGISLATTGDAETKEDGTFTVTFRAQLKRDQPPPAGPRKVRRRKNETEDQYMTRVREAYPRNPREKDEPYAARLALVTIPAAE